MEIILKIDTAKLNEKEFNYLLMLIGYAKDKGASIESVEKPSEEEKKKAGRPKKITDPLAGKEEDEIKDIKGISEGEMKGITNEPVYTLEDIREKVIKLRDAGKKSKTLEVMQKFGISKLSDLGIVNYANFMDDLNKL